MIFIYIGRKFKNETQSLKLDMQFDDFIYIS